MYKSERGEAWKVISLALCSIQLNSAIISDVLNGLHQSIVKCVMLDVFRKVQVDWSNSQSCSGNAAA